MNDPKDIIAGSPAKPGDKEEHSATEPVVEGSAGESQSPSEENATQESEATPSLEESAAAAQNISAEGTPPPPVPQDEEKKEASVKNPAEYTPDKGEKIIAAIGYIGILALIPLLLRSDSRYCQHHGRQSLVIAALFIMLELVFQIIGFFVVGLHGVVLITMLFAWVAGFTLAFSGAWFRVPVVYNWSTELNVHAPKRPKLEDTDEEANTAVSPH